MNCQKCNKKNAIVHHASYDPEKTIWLCKSCHMKEHGRLKKNGTPLHSPRTTRKLIAVSPEVYETLLKGSEKSGRSMVSLADAVITKETNWLNDPAKITEYFSMVKEGA